MIEALLPEHTAMFDRDPQKFGMVSFRGFEGIRIPKVHIDTFGEFGICVTQHWLYTQKAKWVHYPEPGSDCFRDMQALGETGIAEYVAVQREYPDDAFRRMALTNKEAAGICGCLTWAEFLHEYEYLEPYENRYQNEVRICNPEPFYSIPNATKDAVTMAVEGKGWAKHTNRLPLPIEAVRFLIARKERVDEVKQILEELDLDLAVNVYEVCD